MCLIIFLNKCNEKKKKKLEHDKKRKQLDNNPKMKNLKFLTCKRHNASSLERIHEWILNFMI
jgi:hypothetical protein